MIWSKTLLKKCSGGEWRDTNPIKKQDRQLSNIRTPTGISFGLIATFTLTELKGWNPIRKSTIFLGWRLFHWKIIWQSTWKSFKKSSLMNSLSFPKHGFFHLIRIIWWTSWKRKKVEWLWSSNRAVWVKAKAYFSQGRLRRYLETASLLYSSISNFHIWSTAKSSILESTFWSRKSFLIFIASCTRMA